MVVEGVGGGGKVGDGVKMKITNDELSYLIVRSLTEGEVIETIDEVDRDIIDDMADTDRQIILNFLEKYRPQPRQRTPEEIQQSIDDNFFDEEYS